MNQLDKQYQELLFDIIENGSIKNTRNEKTRSIFGKQIRHKMSEGFPLLTTKKMYWKGIVTELLWFLRGDTNIKYLIDNNCNIWTGDAYKKYSEHFIGYEDVPNQDWFIHEIKTNPEFAKKWGDLGPVYGKQWRKWKFTDKFTNGQQIAYINGKIDQIANLINDLKTNPDSRRLMVSAWNPADLESSVLPPCHYGFQVYTRELSQRERCEIAQIDIDFSDKIKNYLDEQNIPTRAISLMWNQRSVDTFLGLPFNIASYGLLLEIIAKMVNMVPDELIGNLGDIHLYEDHLTQAREQLVREPYQLPKLEINDQYWVDNCGLDTHILSMLIEDFKINDYQSHPTIKAPLIN